MENLNFESRLEREKGEFLLICSALVKVKQRVEWR